MTAPADIFTLSPADEIVEAVPCAHCDQLVPRGLIDPNAAHQFCCVGCRAVYETLHQCGLDDYYRLRQAADAPLSPVTASRGSFEAFDSPSFHERFVRLHDDLATVDLVLEGVSCAACLWLIERLPRVLEGLIEARLSLREATVRVTWDLSKLPLSRIARTLDGLGYTPHPARAMEARKLHQRETRRRLVHLAIAGAIMGNTMLLGLALYAGDFGTMEAKYRMAFRWTSLMLGMISLAWPGAAFFKGAWAAIRLRTTNLDVPIALALLAGGVAGIANVILNRGEIYFDSLTVLVFLLLVGRFFQYRQQRRADDAVGLLFSLMPSTCRIVRDGQVIEAPIDAVQLNDLLEVHPGDIFPADGIVEQGRSNVNQALLTGESMPVAVEIGSSVHAGSQNVDSPLRIRAMKVGGDTRVSQLMRLIERGVQDKPPIVQFTDKVGGWFVIIVSLAAAVVFGYWGRFSISAAIDHSVALLIVTCPCVLGLTTPLTLAIAIGRLARRDILVKSGAALERLSRSGQILLDKTGTLTEGRLKLLCWVGDETIQPAVAELERKSTHPVGRALHQALQKPDAPEWIDGELTDIIERGDGGISGRAHGRSLLAGSPGYLARCGVSFNGKFGRAVNEIHDEAATAIVIAIDPSIPSPGTPGEGTGEGLPGCAVPPQGPHPDPLPAYRERGSSARVVAVAGLGDQIRADAEPAVEWLSRNHWRPAMLSGDAQEVVSHVASCVGIASQDAHGTMTPEQKLDFIRQHRSEDEPIVMVGDGINDSAALGAADVGIAVQGGAEASLAAADVYIARPGLSPLVELIRTSQITMRTIRRNLAVSLGYNLFAGALAAAGLMSPMVAAILMPLSSATVLWLAAASIGRRKGGPSWK